MTDPKQTTSDVHTDAHGAGQPNAIERDPDQGSDVGGPAGGVQTTLEDGLAQDSSVGDGVTDSQARNPL